VLLLALAVPAFNYIMGNRSTQAAENIVSAMLGRARGYAIANQCYCGVAVLLQPGDRAHDDGAGVCQGSWKQQRDGRPA